MSGLRAAVPLRGAMTYREPPRIRCEICDQPRCDDPRCDSLYHALRRLRALENATGSLRQRLADTRASARAATVAALILGLLPLVLEAVIHWGR